RGEFGQALAERAIADLVVVLQEVDEGGGGKAGRGLAAWLAAKMFRRFALVAVALSKAAREQRRRVLCIVLVVALVLAGQKHVGGVVKIVVPLAVVERCLAVLAHMQRGNVAVVLGDEMARAVGELPPHLFGKLDQQLPWRGV